MNRAIRALARDRHLAHAPHVVREYLTRQLALGGYDRRMAKSWVRVWGPVTGINEERRERQKRADMLRAIAERSTYTWEGSAVSSSSRKHNGGTRASEELFG